MILTVKEFIEKTKRGNEIPDSLRESVDREIREDHRDAEYDSWVNSYQALSESLENSNISMDV